ncbi:hypothetical protein C8F04DRAFT_1283550 [Mycena alexandri]|uniref:Uncharacterized protein n=1 Tax=Mycena alexandri TaxID=1745969 RepID=A0AAD6RVF6_9AGAR|nr:hypothetical protein C8F04DRAFT_1283550 [Mycena alexandri]
MARTFFGTFPRLTPTRRAPGADIELLNLYGSFDDKPRIHVQDLANFCKKRCTMLFLRNESDLEQYPSTAQLRSVRLVDNKEFQSFFSLTTEYAARWTQLDASINWDGLYELGREGMEVYVGSPETNFVWEW